MNRLEFTDFQTLIGTSFSFQQTLEIPSFLASADNSPVMRKEEIQAELILTSVKIYDLNSRDRRAVESGDEFRRHRFQFFLPAIRTPTWLKECMMCGIRHSLKSRKYSSSVLVGIRIMPVIFMKQFLDSVGIVESIVLWLKGVLIFLLYR